MASNGEQEDTLGEARKSSRNNLDAAALSSRIVVSALSFVYLHDFNTRTPSAKHDAGKPVSYPPAGKRATVKPCCTINRYHAKTWHI